VVTYTRVTHDENGQIIQIEQERLTYEQWTLRLEAEAACMEADARLGEINRRIEDQEIIERVVRDAASVAALYERRPAVTDRRYRVGGTPALPNIEMVRSARADERRARKEPPPVWFVAPLNGVRSSEFGVRRSWRRPSRCQALVIAAVWIAFCAGAGLVWLFMR